MRSLATHPTVTKDWVVHKAMAKATVRGTTSSSSMGMEQALDILLRSKPASIDLDLDTRRATMAEEEAQDQEEEAHMAVDSRVRRGVTQHR